MNEEGEEEEEENEEGEDGEDEGFMWRFMICDAEDDGGRRANVGDVIWMGDGG